MPVANPSLTRLRCTSRRPPVRAALASITSHRCPRSPARRERLRRMAMPAERAARSGRRARASEAEAEAEAEAGRLASEARVGRAATARSARRRWRRRRGRIVIRLDGWRGQGRRCGWLRLVACQLLWRTGGGDLMIGVRPDQRRGHASVHQPGLVVVARPEVDVRELVSEDDADAIGALRDVNPNVVPSGVSEHTIRQVGEHDSPAARSCSPLNASERGPGLRREPLRRALDAPPLSGRKPLVAGPGLRVGRRAPDARQGEQKSPSHPRTTSRRSNRDTRQSLTTRVNSGAPS